MTRRVLLCAVAVAIAAFNASAQDARQQSKASIPDAARVRVWATAPGMIGQDGTFLSLSGDTLRVQVGNHAEVFPVAAVYRFDVNTRAAGGHKLVGFISGVLVGAVVGYTAFRPSAAICEFKCNMRPVNAAFFGLVVGIGGAVAGAFLPPSQWDRVDLRAAQTR